MRNSNKILLSLAALAVAAVILQSWKSIPKNAKAVKPFDKERYLGKWYEIARFDYRFEKGLDNVTATYSLKDDGSIKVDNKGYDRAKDKWKESIGKAKFVDDPNEAKLKVSFFDPFYAGYNVIAIDRDYKYALIAGRNTNYMWLLSREKTMPESVQQEYLKIAQGIGYNINELLWVKHDK